VIKVVLNSLGNGVNPLPRGYLWCVSTCTWGLFKFKVKNKS